MLLSYITMHATVEGQDHRGGPAVRQRR